MQGRPIAVSRDDNLALHSCYAATYNRIVKQDRSVTNTDFFRSTPALIFRRVFSCSSGGLPHS